MLKWNVGATLIPGAWLYILIANHSNIRLERGTSRVDSPFYSALTTMLKWNVGATLIPGAWLLLLIANHSNTHLERPGNQSCGLAVLLRIRDIVKMQTSNPLGRYMDQVRSWTGGITSSTSRRVACQCGAGRCHHRTLVRVRRHSWTSFRSQWSSWMLIMIWHSHFRLLSRLALVLLVWIWRK